MHSPSVLGCLLCHVTTSLLSTIFLVLLFSYTGYTLVSVFCFHHHLLLFDAYKKPITSFPLHEIHIAVWATYGFIMCKRLKVLVEVFHFDLHVVSNCSGKEKYNTLCGKKSTVAKPLQFSIFYGINWLNKYCSIRAISRVL